MLIQSIAFMTNKSNRFFVETDEGKYSFSVTDRERYRLYSLPPEGAIRGKGYVLLMEAHPKIEIDQSAKALIESSDGSFRFKCRVKRLKDSVEYWEGLKEYTRSQQKMGE